MCLDETVCSYVVHRNPTHNVRYLHRGSNYPFHVKGEQYKAWFRGNKFCKSKQESLAELQKVKKDLASNAYPVCSVASLIHKKPRCSEVQRGSDEKPLCIVSV